MGESIKTFATWLPVFPGFYQTIFDTDTDDIEYDLFTKGIPDGENRRLYTSMDNIIELVDSLLNYDEYTKRVAISACKFIENECPIIESIEMENVEFPKYYNYSNSVINCKITVDMDKLMDWIDKNQDMLNEYIGIRYSCHDGFISFYPSSLDEWRSETEGFQELDGHYLGSLLDAYFEDKGKKEDEDMCSNMYFSIDTDIDIDESRLPQLLKEKGMEFSIVNTQKNKEVQEDV